LSTTVHGRRDLSSFRLGDVELDFTRIRTGHDDGPGWMHSGIAALPDGTLFVAHPQGHDLIRIDSSGGNRRIRTELTEMHSIAAVPHHDSHALWVADNGHRFVHGAPEYGEYTARGRVVQLALDGTVLTELQDPVSGGPWSPTSVAVDPASGDVWVADGYGQSLVHRYDSGGVLQATLDGSQSGVTFSCPHGIFLRDVGGQLQLYVADRSNHRIVVYSVDGTFLRAFGATVLDSPSSLTEYEGFLLVTELFGAIAAFDGDDYVGHLGSSPRSTDEPRWPNTLDDDGDTIAPALADRTFNSPHGITVHQGAIYLTEWLIGGRVVRLSPSSPTPGAGETR